MGVRAKCSRCDYLRTFAEELRGTYYRCPKCRQGVIAVPTDAASNDESAEAPRVRAARMPDNRSSEVAARKLETESGERPAAVSSASDDGTPDDEVSDNPPDRGVDETPRGVLTMAVAERGSKDEASEDAVSEGSGRLPGASGQTFKVRRILVECAGCGNHVAVPPQFFGKTVHCPECKADMAFSESSLEPVKDEILGRIALEQAERRVLQHAVPPPIESPELRRRARRKQIAVVGGLVLALLVGVVLVLWKLFASRPHP